MVQLLMLSRFLQFLARYILPVTAGMAVAFPACADPSRWYQVGLGAVATSEYAAPILEFGLNYQDDSDFYAARLSEVPGIGMFVPCAWTGRSDCTTRRGVGALSFLYGSSALGLERPGLFAVGLSAVWGNELNSPADLRNNFVSVGLALETQVIFRPAAWFKFGVSAELNINPSVPFGSLNLFIPFGGV